jgi:hypothetical protein
VNRARTDVIKRDALASPVHNLVFDGLDQAGVARLQGLRHIIPALGKDLAALALPRAAATAASTAIRAAPATAAAAAATPAAASAAA